MKYLTAVLMVVALAGCKKNPAKPLIEWNRHTSDGIMIDTNNVVSFILNGSTVSINEFSFRHKIEVKKRYEK